MTRVLVIAMHRFFAMWLLRTSLHRMLEFEIELSAPGTNLPFPRFI